MWILIDIGILNTYPFLNNTGPFGNNTSVDQKVNRKSDVVALVGDPKALSQEETNNVDESTKLNETPNERSIINKKYLEKKAFY